MMFEAINTIKTQLINEAVFEESCCNISLDLEDLRHPPCDLYCLIKPERFNSHQGTAAGGHTLLIGEVRMRVWILNSNDPANGDPYACELILNKIEEIIVALQLFFPCCECDLPYFAEPIRLLNISEIARHDVKNYLYVDLRFEAKITERPFSLFYRNLTWDQYNELEWEELAALQW